MNSTFKNYQKALNKRRPVADGFESLSQKTTRPSSLPAFEAREKDKLPETDKLARLKAHDRAISKKLVDEIEQQLEEHRRSRQAKKEEEEKEAQILAQQQQQQSQSKTAPPPSSRPKRGGAFLGLGRKKATQAQVKRTKPEMVSSKGGG